jgi:hypothetical protein
MLSGQELSLSSDIWERLEPQLCVKASAPSTCPRISGSKYRQTMTGESQIDTYLSSFTTAQATYKSVSAAAVFVPNARGRVLFLF